ncbi:MAG: hypothetical protein RL684_1341 [Pseudomonadota bacterium]|jgi:hypothetical protein
MVASWMSFPARVLGAPQAPAGLGLPERPRSHRPDTAGLVLS